MPRHAAAAAVVHRGRGRVFLALLANRLDREGVHRHEHRTVVMTTLTTSVSVDLTNIVSSHESAS